jgi:hypothetical protein
MSAQPHEKIEALEAEIEALSEAAERCRKIMVAANAGTFAGAFSLVLSLLGLIGPVPFVLSIATFLLGPRWWERISGQGTILSHKSGL